jgi:hypothetical protein
MHNTATTYSRQKLFQLIGRGHSEDSSLPKSVDIVGCDFVVAATSTCRNYHYAGETLTEFVAPNRAGSIKMFCLS